MPRTPDWVLERVEEEDRNTWEQQELLTTPGVSPATIDIQVPGVARYNNDININSGDRVDILGFPFRSEILMEC